ncbi:MAG: hypothetical protein C0404_13915 [Verrucomicrobia bacterium]|nr:hypothetical protein [Verrucomicrobiota bacterium]
MKKCTTVFVGMMMAAAATVAAETISEESLLSSHENRDAYTPAVAYGKDMYLIVWQSGRFGEGDLRKGFEGLGIGDIVGCRVDKSGKPLDAKPFVICGAKDLQEHPKVVFAPSTGSGQGNGVFLVVWHDLRPSAGSGQASGKDWDVYAARVSPEGKVLDVDGFLVAGGLNNQACPRVTFDGKDFVVVWQDFRSNSLYESYGARVSSDGKVLDAQGVLIQSGKGGWGYHCELPAAASPGGGRSLLLWLGQTCFSGAGAPTAGTAIFVDGKATPAASFKEKDHGPGTASSPACLAAGKSAFLAVWRTDSTGGRGNAPNASSAMVLDADGKLVKRLHVAGGTRIQAPDATWDGTSFVAAWHQSMMAKANASPYHGVFLARVSEAGEPIGAVQSISGTFASPAAEPGVASDGAGTTAIVYEKHPEKSDVPIRIGLRVLGAK